MGGWRGLVGAAVQWTLLVPFLTLTLLILTLVPDPVDDAPWFAGRWSSTTADEWAGKPLLDLSIDALGSFELRVMRREANRGLTVVRGRYEVLHGVLVMLVRGQRMVWSLEQCHDLMSHKTAAGVVLSLERTPSARRPDERAARLEFSGTRW